MGSGRNIWAVACAATMLLAGCGGSDGGGQPPAPMPVPVAPPSAGVATLNTDGGKVTGEGAEIVIPPTALAETVTIRIARDSSGAPPLPVWVRPAGDTLSLTPHGATFVEPVTVRLAAPDLALQPNERLMIAKAQPGGSWEVLGDTELKDGKLEAQVHSFSYFTSVVVTYALLPNQITALPFAMSAVSFICNGEPCPRPTMISNEPITATASGNGGLLPQNCVNPEIFMVRGASLLGQTLPPLVPATPSVVVRRNVSLAALPVYRDGGQTFTMYLRCVDPNTNTVSHQALGGGNLWAHTFPQFPGAPLVRQFPSALTLAPGESATLRAILSGGSAVLAGQMHFAPPTATDQAVVSFERMGPDESSWRILSQSNQMAANPSPTGAVAWAYWSFDYPVGPVDAADNGAQYRIRACYKAPSASETRCAIGPVAVVTVVQQATAPAFTQQPGSQLVRPGETASFSAVVGGTPAPTLRWQTRASSAAEWADVQGGSGADTPNYTTPVVTLTDNGRQYRLLASNSAASVGSDAATLSVSAAPAAPGIVAQPASLSVVAGSEALFAVTAQGTAALSYQWLRNGAAIVGANASQLKLPSVTAADAAVYAVVVSNAVGEVRSQDALLAVTDVPSVTPVAPTIVTQPVAVAVTEGNTATFAVGVQGTGPLAFQWLRNGAMIAGATAAAYTLPAAAMGDAGNYSVRVSNATGTVTSQTATLAVVPTVVPPTQEPVIVQHPGGLVVAPGMSAMLGVTATGSGPLQYQWYRGGVALAGATQAVYAIGSASALDAGSYHVVVSNAAGSAHSEASVVMLLGSPAITTQPTAASVAEGASAAFGVTATGDHLRYQWTRNGIAIVGATQAGYTTPAVASADSGAVFAVIVYNGAGLVVSNGAVLTVTAAQPSQWQAAVPVESNSVSAQFPQVAANASGAAVAVWQQGWTGPLGFPVLSIWASRYTPAGGWGAPQPISDGTNTAQNPQIAVDTDGNAIAVWQQSDNFRDSIWANRYTVAGGWAAPQLIETTDGNAGNPQIAVDGTGNAVAVWWQNVNAAPSSPIGTAANRYIAGSGWSGAVAISSHAGNGATFGPQIAFDAAGNAMATWCWSGATVAPHMWAARHSYAAGWSGAIAIDHADSLGCSTSPNVAFDAAGNAVAVWHRNNGSFEQVRTNRYSAAGGWGTADWLAAAPPNYSRNARVAVDASGDAIAVWEQQVGATANAHVMASRWRPASGWDEPVSIKTDANGSAFGPRIGIDAAGNATVAWYQRDALNIVYNVWAHRYQPAGGWTDAVQIDGHNQDAQRPALAVDAVGRVTVVWEQNTTTLRRNIWAAGYR